MTKKGLDVYCEEVIISNQKIIGTGTESSPKRRLIQVFTKSGELIAQQDTLPVDNNMEELIAFGLFVRENKLTEIDEEFVNSWKEEYHIKKMRS